ncbi:MAG: RodZ domain-containing protein [Rhodospirillales bacterium]
MKLERKSTAQPQSAEEAASIGPMLRASRLRLGQDIDDVAAVLCIRPVYITAIEENRFGDLPGPTYAVGFIRTYADHLGLDSDEILRRFKGEGTSGVKGASLAFPEPIPETGIPSAAMLLLAALFFIAAYGVWYVSTEEDGFLRDLVQQPPKSIQADAPTSVPSPTVAAPDSTASAAPEAAPETASASADAGKPAVEAAELEKVEPTSEPATLSSDAPVEKAEPAAAPTGGEVVQGNPSPTPDAAKPVSEKVAETAPISAAPLAKASTDAAPATPSAAPAKPAPAAAPKAETPISSTPGSTASVSPASTAPTVKPEPKTESASTPAAKIETVVEEVADATPEPSPIPATEAAPTPPASEPAVTETRVAEPPASSPVASPVATQAAEPVATQGEGATRVVLTARQETWMEVRDTTDDSRLLSRVLKVGETFNVPNRPGIELITGNAGGLAVTVDGKPVADLGPAGAVRRGIKLEPDFLTQPR